ncbi:hypothetical protein E3N88_28544 [Mikania micrantha]|uniref:ARID domain-containing protein n=1 Tax=Mikania micrantha TaxID=192012 RepID=A0A5N6MZR3_9ASTR|nr:hypothetical protein E3N88_28544 [Mikania micrantha]
MMSVWPSRNRKKKDPQDRVKNEEKIGIGFEYTNVIKRDGKGKDPVGENESKEVGTIEEMEILLDLLPEINTSIRNKVVVKEKFNKMVKWLNIYVIKKNDLWVSIMEREEVDLYHLYMAVQLNGGKESVTKNGFWSLIAAEMNIDSKKRFQLLLQYNEHLEMMHWYYMNLKKRKQEQGSFAMEHGESSTRKEIAEETKLPFKKRKVSAVSSWPPGCGQVTKKK